MLHRGLMDPKRETAGTPSLFGRVPCSAPAQLDALRRTMTGQSPDDGNKHDAGPPAKASAGAERLWPLVTDRLTAEVTPKLARFDLTLRHTPPVLAGERYAVLCHLRNDEKTAQITGLR